LTRVAVKNRIKSLEQQGIIKGYRAEVDPVALPEQLTFVAFIQTELSAFDEVCTYLRSCDEVALLCQTSGECTLHAVCTAKTMPEMRAFARRVRNDNKGMTRFAAYNVLDVFKGDLLPIYSKEHADEQQNLCN